jgi:hypothetical protein
VVCSNPRVFTGSNLLIINSIYLDPMTFIIVDGTNNGLFPSFSLVVIELSLCIPTFDKNTAMGQACEEINI